MSDDLIFFEEEEKEEEQYKEVWKVLIVDDEKEVHSMSKIILNGIEFENKSIELHSAFSGQEAKDFLEKHDDFALILLDVVMESETAGLEVVKFIRETLQNNVIRIILRTGQPGQAPEREVITRYDINDYKEKTELTAQKLYTVIIAALRSYKDLKAISKSKKGLEKIIKSSKNLFKTQSLKDFVSGVLIQLSSLMNVDEGFLYSKPTGFALTYNENDYHILTGIGKYENLKDKSLFNNIDQNMLQKINKVIENKETMFFDDEYFGYFGSKYGSENVLFMKSNHEFSKIDRDLLTVFSSNIGVAFDNIYLHQREKEKEKLLRRAQKMETVGNLAGGIAHDFNNILTAIMGSVSFLNMNTEKICNDRQIALQKKYLNIIESASHRAADMVKQLLTLSRKQEVHIVPINLNDSINHVVKICKNSFSNNVNIEFSQNQFKPVVKADPTQIEQVLLNLCINALHAMTIMRRTEYQGGTLSIKVTEKKKMKAIDNEFKKIKFWRIIISDTGVGMSKDVLENIFNPFFTTKDKEVGIGLGLAMVYNIVKHFKGDIKVDSEVNVGTTFYLDLPETSSLLEKTDEKTVESITLGKGTLLLVDDEKLVLTMAKGILERCGYDVLTAGNGKQAIEKYKHSKDLVDLVILDMAMPDMSGKEVFKQLKSLNKDIKILIATAFKKDQYLADSLDVNINEIIQKPYSIEELSKAVFDKMDNIDK